MLQATPTKNSSIPESEDSRKVKKPSKNVDKGKKNQRTSATETRSTSSSASSSGSTGNGKSRESRDDSGNNVTLKDVMSFLQTLKADQDNSNARLDEMSTKVNEMYNFEYDYTEGDDGQEFDIEPDENNNHDIAQNVNPNIESDNTEPPAAKKQKTDSDSFFKDSAEKFKVKEKVDKSVDQDLAEMVNSLFRQGIPEEKFSELIKSIDRPENCEALTKTRVNQLIWDLLSDFTKSEENRIQFRQNIIVKAACLVTKLLDRLNSLKKDGMDIPQDLIEMGTGAVGLLGHCNKSINLGRREMHKCDLSFEYFYLCSPSLPFSFFLYGDDISKQVSDIDSVNKAAKKVKRHPPWMINRGGGSSNRGRGRGFRRGGRGRFLRGGRGNHGGRGATHRNFSGNSHQEQYDESANGGHPKNFKTGYGKKKY